MSAASQISDGEKAKKIAQLNIMEQMIVDKVKAWNVSTLKRWLRDNHIDFSGCVEKQELVSLVLAKMREKFMGPAPTSLPSQQTTPTTTPSSQDQIDAKIKQAMVQKNQENAKQSPPKQTDISQLDLSAAVAALSQQSHHNVKDLKLGSQFDVKQLVSGTVL
mmetsp:Transcript_15060/g.22555  ORF Transcript_15060/g.22555 Transcript_15060/m.22555 type:complete len:162 (-) Transcript_15060:3-488(-)